MTSGALGSSANGCRRSGTERDGASIPPAPSDPARGRWRRQACRNGDPAPRVTWLATTTIDPDARSHGGPIPGSDQLLVDGSSGVPGAWSTMGAPASQGGHEFRPDIEGLRGVAVLLVVLFHANLVGVPGGFVGVDVFFVISGFLITGLLLRERERTGRIGFRAFYARRVRRLLPAAMVVLAATLAAASVALSPLDRPQAMVDGAAAALSVGNIRFALAEGDYFASVASPRRHSCTSGRSRSRSSSTSSGRRCCSWRARSSRAKARGGDRPHGGRDRIARCQPVADGRRRELGLLLASVPGVAAGAGRPPRDRR